ncbi:MAG: sigma-54-dependent Fis family transcriptional regulator [Hyphomicrobiales bacterium]|nr:sigma-54-dependent Fis family transcriptional regulator [Hyphomicrobiales bacterium]
MGADILVVDDEEDIREIVAGILSDDGHSPRVARDSTEALAAIAARRPQLAFFDIWLQGSKLDGRRLLEEARKHHPDLPVVMISGHGNIETAVQAIKLGAYDFIEKPFKADRLSLVAERALEHARMRRELDALKSRGAAPDDIVGASAAISQLRATLDRVGPANSRVLITGGPGVGKDLAARRLHALSPRAGAPFVVVNAVALAPGDVEAELFGVEGPDGAPRKVGALEEAHGGTLYLDEVGDMSTETQGKVLRALVDQNFARVGGARRVSVDVRVISSTGRDMPALIAEGLFREDLFHRLAVVPVRVPALAERRDDVPMLVEHFMARSAAAGGPPARPIAPDAMAVLQAHDWPGGVRQLRNNVERLLILAAGAPGAEVTADLLPAEIGALVPGVPAGDSAEAARLMTLPLREAREVFERQYLVAQIGRFSGNVSRTAEYVGMERSALHRKLKSLGIGGEPEGK